MTYASRDDLELRYPQEVEQRESVVSMLGVEQALADADAEIDGYLGLRYLVPLNPVPAHLARMACAIARYRLLGDAATAGARSDYEDARAFLRDVAAGRAQIDGVPAAATAPATAQTVQMVSSGRLFSRESSP